jgi:hypothetical protein
VKPTTNPFPWDYHGKAHDTDSVPDDIHCQIVSKITTNLAEYIDLQWDVGDGQLSPNTQLR